MHTRKGNAAATLLIVLMLVVLCVWFYQAELSDHAQGRNAGVAAVRQARRELGAFGDIATNIALAMPADTEKSADWNAGFRAGVREELKR